jgi:hypothetical protein
MKRLLRIMLQGCLLMAAIALVLLIPLIVRNIARPRDKKSVLPGSPENPNPNQKSLFRRPVFLARTDD